MIEYIESEKEEKNLANRHELNVDKVIDTNIAHRVTFLKTARPILKKFRDYKKVAIVVFVRYRNWKSDF